MRNILFFASDSKSLYLFRLPIMKALSKTFKVICYCPKDSFFEKSKQYLGQESIELRILNFQNTKKNPFYDFFLLFKLINIFSSEKPSYIFSYHIKPNLYTSVVSLFFPKICAFATITGLSSIFWSGSKEKSVLKKILFLTFRFAFKKTKNIFFQNRDDLDFFIDKGMVRKDQAILVNGSGIDLIEYKWHPLPEDLSFIFVGRLNKDKGLLEYITASKNIKKVYPHISFKIVGPLSKNPSALSTDELQSIQDNGVIDYIGEVDDVRTCLQESTVFVLPSYREGVPRAGIEALAVGRPVITTDAVGCKEIVEDGVNGYQIPIKDAQSLENSMRMMIQKSDVLPEMGKKSRELAEKKFDVKVIVDKMIKCMES